MDLGTIDKTISAAEQAIAGLTCRIALVGTEAFQDYQRMAVGPNVQEIESKLLAVRPEPLTPYEMGVFQGQRQVLMGLTFDANECQNAIKKLRAQISDLQDQRKAMEQRISKFKAPDRRGERPLYAEAEASTPIGDWV